MTGKHPCPRKRVGVFLSGKGTSMTEPNVVTNHVTLYHGSNLDVLPTLPDNSIDSIVTDPPYELGFMGKKWDASGIAYNVDLWKECFRVLKPGGHLLSFGGTRTYHRMAVAIEDAGFEIRDSIHWLYGSGFPKSLDVSKAIDKQAGAVRTDRVVSEPGSNKVFQPSQRVINAGTPITEGAQQWEGWGTALKPAHEPIVMARKPLDQKTVADNVMEWGTGALNIEATRVPLNGDEKLDSVQRQGSSGDDSVTKAFGAGGLVGTEISTYKPEGRWPANIIMDDHAGAALDEQSGDRPAGVFPEKRGGGVVTDFGEGRATPGGQRVVASSGGASGYFTNVQWDPEFDYPFLYTPKPSRKEREMGLDELGERVTNELSPPGSKGAESPRAGAGRNGPRKNFHPTVKPLALMRWLIRLVTPEDGVVMDPFAGSGTTLAAATLEGIKSVGIEMTEDYLPIIEGRCSWAEEQLSAP